METLAAFGGPVAEVGYPVLLGHALLVMQTEQAQGGEEELESRMPPDVETIRAGYECHGIKQARRAISASASSLGQETYEDIMALQGRVGEGREITSLPRFEPTRLVARTS